jgi:hypothetical protein
VHLIAGPSINVDDAEGVEEDSEVGSPAVARFRVWLSQAQSQSVSVDVSTYDLPVPAEGTAEEKAIARAGYDYAAIVNQHVTFSPGQTEKWVEVPIVTDDINEYDEPFGVRLTNETLTVGQSTAVGRITDDDDPPDVSIGDVTVNEPEEKAIEATLTITLSRKTEKEATIQFTTVEIAAPGSGENWEPATKDEDFADPAETTTIPTNVLSFQVSVIPILPDEEYETDEKFDISIAGSDFATLAEDGKGRVTIRGGIGLVENAIYGWEGDKLNFYVKAAADGVSITKFELDVDDDGTYDFETTDIEEDGSALAFDLALLQLLGNPVEDDDYDAKLRVTASNNVATEFDVEITVGNIWPDIQFDEEAVIGALAVPFALPITTSDPGPDTVTQIVVEWGDGISSTISGSSGTPSHLYGAEGHYTIRATTTDEDGSTWAEHEIDIGEDNPPPIDDGSPQILSAVATILANGNGELLVSAEDEFGSSADLTFEWDLDQEGIYETPGGDTLELPLDVSFYGYSAGVKVIDGQGRSVEATFQFTAPGFVIAQPTVNNYRALFLAATPGIPPGWEIHHVIQQRLAQAKRYPGWNVHTMENLRAVPASVHREITAAQNAQWAIWKRDFGWTPDNIPLTEVNKFNAKLDQQFSSRWVSVGAPRPDITKVRNLMKGKPAAQFGLSKSIRWKELGIAVGALTFFNLLSQNARAYERMANFDAEKSEPFEKFMLAYENALTENIEIGRVSKPTGENLTRQFGRFARSLSLNEEAVQKVEIALEAWTSLKLHE